MLQDRLDQGINLFYLGASNRMLMSGDHGGQYYDEVNVMKNYAMDQGIDDSAIFMDHAGFSTYESMARAKDVFEVESVIIVTQGYHLSRALYVANELGLDAYGVASDPRQYSNQMYRDLRELAARVKDFGTSMFKPDPTYLGEVIPISGSGEATND
jgi:vancomycin permeability regulator SanA